ncbi:MAG: hypothetical protein A3F13_01360 [Gammaproteobacteria bacterium RIFCSPHIGHO2_12_FULL_40_19]|nr:MAG: hypothetical protein A3F13_01360 [Gammaproteobacteria bacterium RIFCSPHIGHO2_12_FULL_40_19]
MDKLISFREHPPLKILIVGAGIAGLTAAYWLHQYGFDVDIIEKVESFGNQKGYVIDFWGPGFAVLEKMDLVKTLHAKNHALKEFIFVDEAGNQDARFSIPKFRQLHNQRVFTLLRGDLDAALRDCISSYVPIHAGIVIDSIDNTNDTVLVHFSNRTEGRYDVVIGADGIHSRTRALVFGDESHFSHYLGYQLAAAILPNNADIHDALYTYSATGKQVAVCPIDKHQLATYFVYRSPEKDLLDAKQNLQMAFKNEAWVIPRIFESIAKTDAIFFDTLTQIEMPTWHKNRVVLLGDACQCLTLMGGQGASMAMAGAYVLSTVLNQHNNNIQNAFLCYESIMQPEIKQKQAIARRFLNTFIPTQKIDNASRNFFTRQFFKNMYFASTVDEYCRIVF